MFDLNTAVQTALSPVVTLSVIAALIIAIAAQAYFNARRTKARLRALSIRLGKMTSAMLAMLTVELERKSERQIGQAIEATYDALKDIGFDKLARGDVTFEGVMFGDPTPKSEPLRRRQFDDRDPFASFSLDELREALGGKSRYSGAKSGDPFKAGNHSDAHFEESLGNPGGGEGLEGTGPRPYHKAHADHGPRDF